MSLSVSAPDQDTSLLLSMFGDPREMELHYFLADDTIEILEKIPPNSGRDAVPMFLRRARLPKDPVPLRQPGVETKRTVLNVFGPMGHGGRYILDSLKVSAQGTYTSLPVFPLQLAAVRLVTHHNLTALWIDKSTGLQQVRAPGCQDAAHDSAVTCVICTLKGSGSSLLLDSLVWTGLTMTFCIMLSIEVNLPVVCRL